MTDFLTRLAERTLGLAPRVEPLLASRYAPGPGAAVFPDNVGEEPAQPPDEPMHAPAPRFHGGELSVLESVLPRRATEAVANSSKSLRGEKTVAGAVLPPVSPSVTDSSAPPADASLDETPAPSSEKAAALDAGQPISPRAVSARRESPMTTGLDALSAESNALPAATSPEAPRSQPVRASSPASPVRCGETATADPHGANSATSAVAPANQSPQDQEALRAEELHAVEPNAAPRRVSSPPHEPVEATLSGRGMLVQPVVERAASRADAVRPLPAATADHGEPVPPTNESGPPVIRVTIGRIEVRAMLPPTEPANRPAAVRTPPVLSLDEYLKQHSGGNR